MSFVLLLVRSALSVRVEGVDEVEGGAPVSALPSSFGTIASKMLRLKEAWRDEGLRYETFSIIRRVTQGVGEGLLFRQEALLRRGGGLDG